MIVDDLILDVLVPGEPVSWRRAIPVGRGRVSTEEKSATKKKQISIAARAQKPICVPAGVAVAVGMTFVFSTERGYLVADLDRLVNLVLDALSRVTYADDKQVTMFTAQKAFGTPAGTHITVRKL